MILGVDVLLLGVGNSQENFDLVNVGLVASKTLKVADLSIPVSGATMWNPSLKIARAQLAVILL